MVESGDEISRKLMAESQAFRVIKASLMSSAGMRASDGRITYFVAEATDPIEPVIPSSAKASSLVAEPTIQIAS